jgi:hydroxylamine reductase
MTEEKFDMFCFQCEQTASCSACTGKVGVCGKTAEVSDLQDELVGALVGLARTTQGAPFAQETNRLVIEDLFATLTNVNFDGEDITRRMNEVHEAAQKEATHLDKEEVAPDFDLRILWEENEDVRSLKSLVLFGLKGMAAYAYHAMMLGRMDETVSEFFAEALYQLGETLPAEDLLGLAMKLGEVNLTCMALLDEANTGTYGDPVPVQVSQVIEEGPFILVSGHDLHDLKLLLEQTEGRGVNVYTHSEMLPAHAYPELKKYAHLKGNFGTAWQNQQKEFEGIPAPVLFTTNCLMPPRESYADRVYTTGTVAYPELKAIDADKDFTPLIEHALELGGYAEPYETPGINGGLAVTTGFGRATVLGAAGTVIEAVNEGALRHIFLVGGCDGARKGRSYFTEFVKQTPADTAVLTLACGKYRFNDLELGEIGGLPRVMDMGQCNDAYGAIMVAVALAEAFGCGVNDLPLTLVLSWYEQKAVCILLTLLSLGIKGIYLGPTLPAFVSPGVLDVLVKEFDVRPISTPEEDLATILG